MNPQFSQAGGSVSKDVNKQSIARVFGVKMSEVAYLKAGLLVDSYKVLYDKTTQTCWFRGSATGTPTSWEIAEDTLTLVTSAGTFNLRNADLRSNLGSDVGFKHIGQVESYAALKNIIPDSVGQRILLASYYANGVTGGGEFVARAGTATDDGGTICVPTGSSTWYWQRVGVVDFDVTWFGAIGDSNTANSATNTTAIQKALDAAAIAGLASVKFPQSAGFYACGTIYVKPGVSLVGAGRTRGLLGATVYLRAGANAVISQEFKGLWCKQSHFNLWDPDSAQQRYLRYNANRRYKFGRCWESVRGWYSDKKYHFRCASAKHLYLELSRQRIWDYCR